MGQSFFPGHDATTTAPGLGDGEHVTGNETHSGNGSLVKLIHTVACVIKLIMAVSTEK